VSRPDPWTVDIILPEQWRTAYGEPNPERLLRIAVLTSAVRDLQLPHVRGHCYGCDVILWMLGATGAGSIPFADVCFALGLAPDGVARGLRAKCLPHVARTVTFTIHVATLDSGADAGRAVSPRHQ
jgi:hypothetical protein